MQHQIVSSPDPEAAQAAAEEILSQGGYETIREAGDDTDFWTGIADLWGRLSDFLRGLHDGSGLTYWLIVLALVLTMSVLIWHMIWTIRKSSKWTGWEELDPNLPHGKDVDAALADAAHQAAEDGRRIEALSFRFRLALYRHSRNHPGALRPGYTNRECLTAWKGQPAIQAAMTDVVRLLDRCWYAQQECSQAEFDDAWATLEGRGVE